MIEERAQGKPKNKVPISFLRTIKGLTVDGRARRTLTDAQFEVLKNEFEMHCDRKPDGVSEESWVNQLEEFSWQVIFEKGRDKVGDRVVGGVATTYQTRIQAMFNAEFLPRLRQKIDTFNSASSAIGMMLPGFANMQVGNYAPDRRNSTPQGEASSPYGLGFQGGNMNIAGGGLGAASGVVPQQLFPAGGGGGQQQAPKAQLPQVCWHYLKSTPCIKPTMMGANGVLRCQHGMHPARGQLDQPTFEAIKKSKFGKKQLKNVAFESWLCIPVPTVQQMPQPMQFGFGLNNMPNQMMPQQQFQFPAQQAPQVQVQQAQAQQMQVPQVQNPMLTNPMLQQMMNMLMQQQMQQPR
eukprot:g19047.t1